MKKKPLRLFIYTKDVMNITGKSERHAQDLLNKIRKALGKQNYHPVTIPEFCRFLHLDINDIYDAL